MSDWRLPLPEGLAPLRQLALAAHRERWLSVPELTLAEARAWRERPADEPWLLWRARRCAARLRALPLVQAPGELLAGRPRLRDPEPTEQPLLDAAKAALADCPPFPGGDAGHFHPDFDKLFDVGVGGLLREVAERRLAEGVTEAQVEFYDACWVVLEALAEFVERCGLPTEPPSSFREAIGLMFAVIVALTYAEDHYLTSPGRVDRTLWRFYEVDLTAGVLSREEAFELLCCLYIQMNLVVSPSLAIAVMVGGQGVCSELSHLALEARRATRLAYPTIGLAWHPELPDALMEHATEVLASGIGCPAFFNEPLIADSLAEHGVSADDRYNFINSTCVEIKVAGASNMWVTQPYFNCAQALLTELAAEPATFDELCARVKANLGGQIATAAASLDRTWAARAQTGGFPLASCFTADCLARGLDFDRGGARYHWVENSFVGLANLVDSLVALRAVVYEGAELSVAAFREVLAADFAGHERLRQRLVNSLPKYGNDDPLADGLAAEWAQFLIDSTEAQTVGGHRYVPGFFCWVMHERLGSQTGATPDGRRAGWALADGAGAAQGRERHGPTASILSTTCWSHRAALGGLVHNLKFSDRLLAQPHGRQALRDAIETYMRRGGLEIQINVVGRETLLAARANPERYPDLVVRVAGYSDYFVNLSEGMQLEVLERTEFGA